MSDFPTLLPNNATDLELALEQASEPIGEMALPVAQLWDPDNCPVALLPWLAWAFSVDEWDAEWGEGTKREVIRQSAEVHRRKGTKGALVRAMTAAGFGASSIVEGAVTIYHDASADHDGSETYGQLDHWANYQVIVERPITIAQGQTLRRILESVAPLRCHLARLDFSEVSYTYNAAITYDGANTHGVV